MAIALGLTAGVTSSADDECSSCHDDAASLVAASIHGFADCTDCHAGREQLPHADDAPLADCTSCHEDPVAEYGQSVHAQARLAGATEAPDCAACHGPIHELVGRDDPSSPVNHARLADTCGACHSNPELMHKFGILVARPVEAYRGSVHTRVIAEGKYGATCNDCHGSHAIYGSGNPRSSVYFQRVPDTCGHCHADVTEAFNRSVHGTAVMHGVREAPVCTNCHGEHHILSPSEHGSPAFATNVPKMVCGRCHGDLRLAQKYGLAEENVTAYRDSYHGLASRSGSTTVAHCGSCHGVHDVLPSSDPRSHTNVANLSKTCGQCHPGAGQTFAIGTVHVLPTSEEHYLAYLLRRIYIVMIVFTIGFMLLHNGLDFASKLRHPPQRVRGDLSEPEPRMTPGFRVSHGLLMSSFFVLVYTGFSLTYPEAWWARPVLAWEEGLGLRGWLHRVAALVMLAAFLLHAIHLYVNPRARRCMAGMLPRLADVREFRERMLYYLGRRPAPPHVPKLGYPEKMEYIALVWGMVVMAVTGFMLWFENLSLRWLPKWASDAATVVHFYEAVLASLAILVWHLYFVIFDPIVYPMDTAWLTGQSAPGRIAERVGGDAQPPGPDDRFAAGPNELSETVVGASGTGRPR